MAAQQSGTSPPPKPWDRSGSSSGPAPFKPPSAGTTSDVVEASGTARPGEIVTPDANTPAANTNTLGRSLPSRPWEQHQTYGNNNSYMGAGYGSSSNYNSGYGSGTYGSSGGGMYGNSMYRGGMNGGAGSLYGGGMYGGGGMYNSSFGGAMGGYGGMGMGMGGPPYGDQDPNNPFAAPSSPPGFWVSFMHVMQGVVTFFGRVAMLIDQNTQAFHMFMSALLQLFDRSGMLYGELARFVFRLLGIRTKSQKAQPPQPNGLPGPRNYPGGQNHIEGPKIAPSGAWDNVWGNE